MRYRRRPSWMFCVGFILISFLQDLSTVTVEASRDPDLHQTIEKRSNGDGRFLRHSRHQNKADARSPGQHHGDLLFLLHHRSFLVPTTKPRVLTPNALQPLHINTH